MTMRFPEGRRLLVPYVTGGLTTDWTDYLLAYQDAGADAVEVGLPFSDPMLDGTTIQQAADRALTRGATTDAILADLTAVGDRLSIPVVVMTYANLVLHTGVAKLQEAGVAGLIVPDLPLEESGPLEQETAAAGIDLVLLAAPSTPDDRLQLICRRSRGFVYAVSVMGVTGERATVAPETTVLAHRLKNAAKGRLPVLIGFGVSTPGQAAVAGRAGDGVVVASALMRRVLDGATPADLSHDVAALRAALDDPIEHRAA
ncbi:tryptophan synthase subunit alpha [Actinoplanes sp. N902-109]|uniref:tryptophan synthase subunit alpha n=1 Tax=Actinoplanes sp. (strain N902-109) TaxID=649831 RepID=UPI0003296043|nr:tryptophan synthase subunit alpha [Actinoplanes sp. N902-109]AGL18086.1 tryptophan synthase, alpha subunit [Actinoplanes sp. N902-109]